MKATSLLRILGGASCLALASCNSLWPYGNSTEASERSGSGYSLDNPASGQSRYMAGPQSTGTSTTTTTTTTESTTAAGPTESLTTESTTTSTIETPQGPSTTPPPGPSTAPTVSAPVTSTQPASPTAAAPTYGSPVPGRRGFVYPPGVEAKPENMVDVRDFTPGQKVRDPRTGKIFLVP